MPLTGRSLCWTRITKRNCRFKRLFRLSSIIIIGISSLRELNCMKVSRELMMGFSLMRILLTSLVSWHFPSLIHSTSSTSSRKHTSSSKTHAPNSPSDQTDRENSSSHNSSSHNSSNHSTSNHSTSHKIQTSVITNHKAQ